MPALYSNPSLIVVDALVATSTRSLEHLPMTDSTQASRGKGTFITFNLFTNTALLSRYARGQYSEPLSGKNIYPNGSTRNNRPVQSKLYIQVRYSFIHQL